MLSHERQEIARHLDQSCQIIFFLWPHIQLSLVNLFLRVSRVPNVTLTEYNEIINQNLIINDNIAARFKWHTKNEGEICVGMNLQKAMPGYSILPSWHQNSKIEISC